MRRGGVSGDRRGRTQGQGHARLHEVAVPAGFVNPSHFRPTHATVVVVLLVQAKLLHLVGVGVVLLLLRLL